MIPELAPTILAEIKKAKSVLLCCHPSPDPDSVGSVLAMKWAIESLGGAGSGPKVTAISGDSEIPDEFMHFPGAHDIVPKNFGEVDLAEFDLFISLDASTLDMVSRKSAVTFPAGLKTIVIDHHRTNTKYAQVNLVDASYPATCQILYDLFEAWNIEITPDIAADLFIGIYTDTGGFRHRGTNAATFRAAAKLVEKIPDFSKLITDMDNSRKPETLAFMALALNSITTFMGGTMAIASVSHAELMEKNIHDGAGRGSEVSAYMNSVKAWNASLSLVEVEPGRVKCSFRAKDQDRFDVSKLAVAFGGGGHILAAGANLAATIPEAKKLIIAKAEELYTI